MNISAERYKGNKALFSIGKTAELCDVSTRTLRFYEKNGLISPDYVDEENRYRYYSYETMRRIQAIRYLLDEGFSLSRIEETFHKSDLDSLEDMFSKQIKETESQINYYQQRLASLKAWHSLIKEGQPVLEHDYTSISTRYIPQKQYYIVEHPENSGEEPGEAYLETLFYTEYKLDGHSLVDMGGAFMFRYESYESRMDGTPCRLSLLQEAYPYRDSLERAITFGGFDAICCYHIGDPKDIPSTYRRMTDWADEHGYTLEGSSLERHVLDFYSVESKDRYVTELLLPVLS